MKDIKMKVYEQDREIIKQLPLFSKEEYELVEKDVINFFEERKNTQYFMFLSNDINYYTIFKNSSVGTIAFNSEYVGKTFLDFIQRDTFLKSLGDLKVVKRVNNGDAIEIWIGNTYFLLFRADSFFVNI